LIIFILTCNTREIRGRTQIGLRTKSRRRPMPPPFCALGVFGQIAQPRLADEIAFRAVRQQKTVLPKA
jgi:hypothetical protein